MADLADKGKHLAKSIIKKTYPSWLSKESLNYNSNN
jgi:hypothetical protein